VERREINRLRKRKNSDRKRQMRMRDRKIDVENIHTDREDDEERRWQPQDRI
jgi:hypothetical protein